MVANGDGEGTVVSVTVPSVSVKWMENRNRCDTARTCFSAHKDKPFHPHFKLPPYNNTEKMAAQQQDSESNFDASRN